VVVAEDPDRGGDLTPVPAEGHVPERDAGDQGHAANDQGQRRGHVGDLAPEHGEGHAHQGDANPGQGQRIGIEGQDRERNADLEAGNYPLSIFFVFIYLRIG